LVNFEGEEFVRVSRSDGMGVARLRRAGVPQLILSTETNPVVTARANKLGVDVVQDVSDKAAAVTEWIMARGLDPERVAFVGNDVNDLPAMGRVGWPVAVADARPEVKAAARVVLQHNGGEGAVREICERVLAAQPAAQPAATAIQSR
jgi:YrbI family 3-deoxy-D-manno-octulosonate 8-phosphate phosphatase